MNMFIIKLHGYFVKAGFLLLWPYKVRNLSDFSSSSDAYGRHSLPNRATL
jgi:hypothetical protein